MSRLFASASRRDQLAGTQPQRRLTIPDRYPDALVERANDLVSETGHDALTGKISLNEFSEPTEECLASVSSFCLASEFTDKGPLFAPCATDA
jgi:hypothetical protein